MKNASHFCYTEGSIKMYCEVCVLQNILVYLWGIPALQRTLSKPMPPMLLMSSYINKYIYINNTSLLSACRADWHLHTAPEHLVRFPCQVFFSSSPPCVSILPWAAGMLAYCTKHRDRVLWHLLLYIPLTKVHCILSWRSGTGIVFGNHLGHTLAPNRFFWGNKAYFVVTDKSETAKTVLFFFYLIYGE